MNPLTPQGALLAGRGLRDCEQAISLYESSLSRADDSADPRLLLEAAQAYNAVMRIKTHSNTLHITRMLDTKEHKRVWAALGPRALKLASAAKTALPNDPDAMVAYADAFFFANAVKGVLAAATTGSGLKFKGNAKELIARCPKADGAIGHCYLGAFFLMAPWPLCNARKAEKHLGAAHRIVASRRNCYYMGVMNYRLGRPGEAIPFFEQSIKAKCNSPSESDFGEWMKEEAAAALRVCQEEAGEGK